MINDDFWNNTPLWMRNDECRWTKDQLIEWIKDDKMSIRVWKLHLGDYEGFSFILTPLQDPDFINQIDWM